MFEFNLQRSQETQIDINGYHDGIKSNLNTVVVARPANYIPN